MPADEVLDPLLAGPLALGFAFVLGALFGSFANVCIYRWPPSEAHPSGRSVVTPASHCPQCKAPVRWYDNIPMLSYVWLRGRCRDCLATFSPRYLLVEAATAMLFAAIYWVTVVEMSIADEPTPTRLLRFCIYAALAFVLVVVTFIDLDHKLILDKITYPAIPLFYLLGLLLPERHWSDGLIGIAVGYGVVRAISDGYYHLTGREGLGYGDGKLLAIVGALFGWRAVVFALFGGSVLGSIVGVAALLWVRARRRNGVVGGVAREPEQSEVDHQRAEADVEVPLRHVELPFGPFLATAALAYALMEPWLAIALGSFGRV